MIKLTFKQIITTVFYQGYRLVMKNAILLLSTLTISVPTLAAQEQAHQSYFYLGTGNVGFDTPYFGSDRDNEWSTPHITVG